MKNICIMGLGTIAHRVAKGIQYASNAKLYAVASRDLKKAEAFQQAHNVPHSYGSYSEMVLDTNIDVVYICTPNFCHKEQILYCLHHGKHVICEKPIVLNRRDLSECFTMAKEKGLFLMEAHKTVFTPLNTLLKEMIQNGCIGRVHLIEAQNANDLLIGSRQAPSWHFERDGGGCLYDIGVYPLSYANFFAQSELQDVQIMTQKQNGVYTNHVQANLLYENGVMAHIASSWICPMVNTAYIYGETGRIECSNFWKNTKAVWIQGEKRMPISVEMKSDFTPEIEHAVDCIERGLLESPIMGYTQSDEILKVIEKGEFEK